MMKFIVFSIMLICMASSAKAEEGSSSFSQRFDNCMNSPSCQPAERMAILVQVSSELKRSAELMRQNCIDKNYKSCIGPKSPGTLQWYKMYGYMAEIADSMEKSDMSEQPMPSLPPEDRKMQEQWPNWYQAQKVK